MLRGKPTPMVLLFQLLSHLQSVIIAQCRIDVLHLRQIQSHDVCKEEHTFVRPESLDLAAQRALKEQFQQQVCSTQPCNLACQVVL